MQESYTISQYNPLPKPLLEYIDSHETGHSTRVPTLGGVLSDTGYMWLSTGSHLAVFNAKTGRKVAACVFGHLIKDVEAKIVCVDEIKRSNGEASLLVIALECNLTEGMICIFDISSSKLLRAVQIKEKISCIHVIDGNYDLCPLPGPLRAFDDILAVGTVEGNLYLLDLCRHAYEEALNNAVDDEINPILATILPLDQIRSLERYQKTDDRNEEHFLIHLNFVPDNTTPHFVLKGPKGDNRILVNREEVAVSAIHYCPQLGSLLVGYNFGAWQLWNIMKMKLIYTSPVYKENVPVSHFALQEPCDDPKSFCYVWVIYSNNEQCVSGCPIAVLYSLNYDSKEWHEGYGILYQGLTSCSNRFQFHLDLVTNFSSEVSLKMAQCLRIQGINKTISKSNSLQEYHEETLALCAMIWNCWADNAEVQTVLILFDLNQWYKEQMPRVPRRKENDTYMANVCLSETMQSACDENMLFLDARINLKSLTQFFGTQRLDEHYYPTSLEFDLSVLRERDYALIKNPGIQRTLLSYLEMGGALSLLRPKELYEKCIKAGLLPLFVDLPASNQVSLVFQRNFLLNIALDQQLLGWLCRCAFLWSNGSYESADCTLDYLLAWAWERAEVIKQQINKLCVPLFDFTGIKLDLNSHSLLNSCARQLKTLATLFKYVADRFQQFLSNPAAVVVQKEMLQLVSAYLEVLQWLLNVGLLPECPLSFYPRNDDFDRISIPYPAEMLKRYYDDRREHLQSLHGGTESLLYIDNLIDLECGGHLLQKEWETDEGTGLYPPPSLQALLRTYLLENVDTPIKHCLIIYVFLDLAMTLDHSRYNPVITHLIKFPAVFHVNPSAIKITQAFWQLDHGDFNNAMEQFLDPLISNDDIQMWQHQTALKSLIFQKQHEAALLYLQVRKPPFTKLEDICTVITLLVRNNMLDEAFNFERQYRSSLNKDKTLYHFYKECDRCEKLISITLMLLSAQEEAAFLKYLESVNHQVSIDIRLVYYLKNSRQLDAMQLLDKLKYRKSEHLGLTGQNDAELHRLLLEVATEMLPRVSRNFLNMCKKGQSNVPPVADYPKPMSVFVHNFEEQAKYKSMLLSASMLKARETWNAPNLDTPTNETPFLNTPKSMRTAASRLTPALCPITRIVETDTEPPCKKQKISPGHTSRINLDVTCREISMRLNTPIVKRKISRLSMVDADEDFSLVTPQSILKIRQLVRDSASPENVKEKSPETALGRDHEAKAEDIEMADDIPTSVRKLRLSPRKSLARSPRLAVRFHISKDSDSGSNDSDGGVEPVHSTLNKADLQSSLSEISSKDSSRSNDVFFSPKTSTSLEKSSLETEDEDRSTGHANENAASTEQLRKRSPLSRKTYKRNIAGERVTEGETVPSPSSIQNSPRQTVTRRSTRILSMVSLESLDNTTHLSILDSTQEQVSSANLDEDASRSSYSLRRSGRRSAGATPHVPKLKARMSLSRKVLEINASKAEDSSFNYRQSPKPLSGVELQDAEEPIGEDSSIVVHANEVYIPASDNPLNAVHLSSDFNITTDGEDNSMAVDDDDDEVKENAESIVQVEIEDDAPVDVNEPATSMSADKSSRASSVNAYEDDESDTNHSLGLADQQIDILELAFELPPDSEGSESSMQDQNDGNRPDEDSVDRRTRRTTWLSKDLDVINEEIVEPQKRSPTPPASSDNEGASAQQHVPPSHSTTSDDVISLSDSDESDVKLLNDASSSSTSESSTSSDTGASTRHTVSERSRSELSDDYNMESNSNGASRSSTDNRHEVSFHLETIAEENSSDEMSSFEGSLVGKWFTQEDTQEIEELAAFEEQQAIESIRERSNDEGEAVLEETVVDMLDETVEPRYKELNTSDVNYLLDAAETPQYRTSEDRIALRAKAKDLLDTPISSHKTTRLSKRVQSVDAVLDEGSPAANTRRQTRAQSAEPQSTTVRELRSRCVTVDEQPSTSKTKRKREISEERQVTSTTDTPVRRLRSNSVDTGGSEVVKNTNIRRRAASVTADLRPIIEESKDATESNVAAPLKRTTRKRAKTEQELTPEKTETNKSRPKATRKTNTEGVATRTRTNSCSSSEDNAKKSSAKTKKNSSETETKGEAGDGDGSYRMKLRARSSSTESIDKKPGPSRKSAKQSLPEIEEEDSEIIKNTSRRTRKGNAR